MGLVPMIVLRFITLTNFVRGGMHAFAPDRGTCSIAGLDLTQNGRTILGVFALMGFHQIASGLFQLYVLSVRRDLVLLCRSL